MSGTELEAVIGLEVHVQLATRTKMFCGCPLSFGDPPNVHTCPITASSSAIGAPRASVEADPLLERVGGVEQTRLAEGRADDLEAHRQALG